MLEKACKRESPVIQQSAKEPGEVLVIKLGALGDVILSLPHIVNIQASFPQSRVTLLTAPEYSELTAAVPGLEVVAFPRKGFIAMWQLLCWLLGKRYRVVFDLQGSTRSRIMTLLTQAEKRVGRQTSIAYSHVPAGQAESSHAVQRMNELLSIAGVTPAAPDVPHILRRCTAATVPEWLKNHLPGERKLVLMHAGSSKRWPSKRWEEAHYVELAIQLESRGFSVIWIGGEDDRGLNQRLTEKAGVNATESFSYLELIALGNMAVFAIANDSGPMHVLSMSGIPVYAFFGPTDWQRSHAVGQEEHVLLNPVPCSPCHLKICPPEHRHECLEDISVDAVLSRLQTDSLVEKTV